MTWQNEALMCVALPVLQYYDFPSLSVRNAMWHLMRARVDQFNVSAELQLAVWAAALSPGCARRLEHTQRDAAPTAVQVQAWVLCCLLTRNIPLHTACPHA